MKIACQPAVFEILFGDFDSNKWDVIWLVGEVNDLFEDAVQGVLLAVVFKPLILLDLILEAQDICFTDGRRAIEPVNWSLF